MGTCVFQTKDVARCAAHALAASNWDMAHEAGTSPPGAGLLFVHDSGVYLMSNGVPRDRLPENKNYVAYARHCNPKLDEEWWENSRELVGGDDFAEYIPITAEFLTDCTQFQELHIDVTESEIEVIFCITAKLTAAVNKVRAAATENTNGCYK